MKNTKRKETMMESISRLESLLENSNIANNQEGQAIRDELEQLKMKFSIYESRLIEHERRLEHQSKKKKLYLTEIIDKEKPKFGSNNLILSPVGSGKTNLIEKRLTNGQKDTILQLVSNETLKESISPSNTDDRKNKPNNTFTTKNPIKCGDEPYKIHVMSYAEFGARISIDNEFVKDIKQIYCDEIHSLPEYRDYTRDINLSHAIKYLFQKHDNKQIFYFTATDENLKKLEQSNPGQLKNVKTFDYRNYKNIVKYVERSRFTINHIEQLRPHLRGRREGFEYLGHKILAYAKTIEQEKRIEEIAIAEGFKPLVLWSINNTDYPLSEEQLRARKLLINEEKIPEPYDFLIINSALREGWNLKDDDIQLAIMNTTNETDLIQARGRIRNNIDVLIYRTNDLATPKIEITIPKQYMNTPLTTEDKRRLCEELNVINRKGEQSEWKTIKKIIKALGYKIKEERTRINGTQIRTDTIMC